MRRTCTLQQAMMRPSSKSTFCAKHQNVSSWLCFWMLAETDFSADLKLLQSSRCVPTHFVQALPLYMSARY